MSSFLICWFIGLGAAVALMVVAWALSLQRRDASIVDGFWGAGFVLLAWIYHALGDGSAPRMWILATLVTVWGLRLSAHIIWRNHGKGEDYRYRQMRDRHGERFPLISLFTVFLLQGGLMWLLSAPLLVAQWGQAPLGALDLAGVALFVVGLIFETVGDLQLARFRAGPENQGKVLRTGLWRYTRHPNYFGDAAVWWGLFLIALATPSSAWTVFSPVVMTLLLLKVSGVVLLEKKLIRTRPGYADYASTTSAFFPWFPGKNAVAGSRAGPEGGS